MPWCKCLVQAHAACQAERDACRLMEKAMSKPSNWVDAQQETFRCGVAGDSLKGSMKHNGIQRPHMRIMGLHVFECMEEPTKAEEELCFRGGQHEVQCKKLMAR